MKSLINTILFIQVYYLSSFAQNEVNTYDIGCSAEESTIDMNWLHSRYKELGNVAPPVLWTDNQVYEFLRNKEFKNLIFNDTNSLRENWQILKYVPENIIARRYACFEKFRKADIEYEGWKKEIHQISTITEFIGMLEKYPIHGKAQIEMLEDELNMNFLQIVSKLRNRQLLIYTSQGAFGFQIVENTRFNYEIKKKDANFKRLI
ncbi:MAG: hypothetical protein IPN86_13280 [Saprospiraceae bacterium]|nr:hypothetical protein [Saprospiraceae bacterium]